MHELLLHGLIPSHRHHQVLSILTGLTASQPTLHLERHAVFRPATIAPRAAASDSAGNHQSLASSLKAGRASGASGGSGGPTAGSGAAAGGSGGGGAAGAGKAKELYAMRLVKSVDGASSEGEAWEALDGGAEAARREGWRLVVWETPEAAQKRAAMRVVSETEVKAEGLAGLMDGMGYRPLADMIISGHRFTSQNTNIYVHRYRTLPNIHTPCSLTTPLPPFASTSLVESTGAYLVQASIKVEDGKNAEVVARAVKELEALRSALKGVVELKVPERLALDTRVK